MNVEASWNSPGEWQWFALKVAPGREFAAERILRQDGFDAFVPIKHVGKPKKGYYARPRIIGYVFIGFNTSYIPWADVMRFRMIIGVVSHNGRPFALPAAEMYKVAAWSQRPLRVPHLGKKRRNRKDGPLPILTGPYQGHVVAEIRCLEPERSNESEIAEIFRPHLATRASL